MRDSYKELKQIINGARISAILKQRSAMTQPLDAELWMCHRCESLFGQAKKLTKVITCDECWESAEAERMFFSIGG